MAAEQDSVVARRQLLACAVPNGSIDRLVARRLLLPVHPGVYAYGHPNLTYRGRVRAALLYAGAEAALAGVSAAHWWGLIEHEPLQIELATAQHLKTRPGIRVHRHRILSAVEHRGLRVTTPPETLLQLAASGASHSELRRMLAEAEYRHLTSSQEVWRVLKRGRRGSAALRRALRSHQPLLARARGHGERSFITLLESARTIPMPEINVRISRMTVDALWREQRLVVEIDDTDGHRTPAQINRDHSRDLHLRRLGYTVLRYTYWQIMRHPDLIIGELQRELGRPA